MGLKKEFEMMLQEKLEDGEEKMLESAACTLFYHISRPIFLPHATERERPMSVSSLIYSNIYRSGRL